MAEDFSAQLSAVLSNPDAMGQIMSIAKSLAGESSPSSEADAEPARTQSQSVQPPPELSGLLGLLGGGDGGGASPLAGLDPRLLQLGIRLLSEYNREDDRKTALLTALKPYLRAERAAKMDRAIQAARLSRLARVALELFKDGGETRDV